MIRGDSNLNRQKANNETDSYSFKFVVYEDDLCSDGTDSDGLAIDENEYSPPKSKKRKISKMDPEDKLVLDNIEEEIERQLDEKASKSNMSVANVKNILKHVITNEHVLAMVRQSVNNDSKDDVCTFEPKLTRAKAKELFKEQPNTALTWNTPNKKQSEVHVLINQELPEDSSDEEYVPAEDESDDDQEHSTFSECDSQPATPATPFSIHSMDCATQTSWTEDGLFKVPKSAQSTEQNEANENIALRTRSKFSLSDTPLESIEQAFIPPDITTDMYELECDDDDWQKFLTDFTQPLKQVITETVEDDDEADPEYNVLADEEIDIVDKEELRADKGVKVTKKELNDLMAELFDCAGLVTPPCPIDEDEIQDKLEAQTLENNIQIPLEPNRICNETTYFSVNVEAQTPVQLFFVETTVISVQQKLLLDQQMRQHVQLLTQNFLQTYEHPIFSDLAPDFKKMLVSLVSEVEKNINSCFNAVNLLPAANLITIWEQKFINNNKEAEALKKFVAKQIENHKTERKRHNMYVTEFPPLFKNTVSVSTVFLYPELLPKIQYTLKDSRKITIESEDQLIALGLEQFFSYMDSNREMFKLSPSAKLPLLTVIDLIIKYMMPFKDPSNLWYYIRRRKSKKAKPNAIQYYYIHNKAPCTVHYVIPLSKMNFLPPMLQNKEKLPFQWQNIVKDKETPQNNKKIEDDILQCGTQKLKPLLPAKKISSKKDKVLLNKKSIVNKLNNSNSTLKPSIIKPIQVLSDSNRIIKTQLSHEDTIENNSKLTNSSDPLNQENFSNINTLSTNKSTSDANMLPSMPFLSTPLRDSNTSKENDRASPEVLITTSAQLNADNQIQTKVSSEENTNCETNVNESEKQEILDKDNEQDIKLLMIASSTIKSKTKKPQPSAGEKKKSKIQREYEAMTSLLVPEDPKLADEKANNYAQAYFHKVQERLSIESPDEYNELLATLSEHDESTDSVSDLYNKVEAILSPKHPDLCEEFLTFLTPAQAKEIGKLIPHTMYNNMATFLKKLEIFFSKQPAQIRKIYNTLADFGEKKDVSMDVLKSSIIPLLKGNQLLIDFFLQIFPQEKPPESLMSVWENVNYDTATNPNGEIFEELIVPDVEDPYGGSNCICSCHQTSDELFKTRAQHCIPCGTKFIQGRVFIQSAKGPRPASVSFKGASMTEQYKRLSIKSPERPKKRSETASPIKNLITSPIKNSLNESEDDDNIQTKSYKNSPKPSRSNKSSKCTPTSKRVLKVKNIEKCLKSDAASMNDGNISDNSIKLAPLTISVSPISTDNHVIPKRMSPRFHSQTSSLHDTVISPFSSPTRESRKRTSKVSFSTEIDKDNNSKDVPCSANNEDKKVKHELFEYVNVKVECEQMDIHESEDCNTSIESIELKLSPSHSIESVEMCEESSQDTASVCQDEVPTLCSDGSGESSLAESIHSDCGSLEQSEDSINNVDEPVMELKHSRCKVSEPIEGCSSNTSGVLQKMSWTREEDRIILKTFQEDCNHENIFEKIRQLIPQRTVEDIRQRFQTLMRLLETITETV